MPGDELIERYTRVRSATVALAARFSDEQQIVQSMPEASPVKWHLAHTTWFFERMVLREHDPDYAVFDPAYDYLFNSYYESMGARLPRAQRGLITTPSLSQVRAYRSAVDARMRDVLPGLAPALREVARLGCEHEQQHQELILTDAKHALCAATMDETAVSVAASHDRRTEPTLDGSFVAYPGGLRSIGADAQGVAFDNERPRHRVWLEPFALATRCVTNAEFLEFIECGGYRDPAFWLADGWSTLQQEDWQAPLYWVRTPSGFVRRTLAGSVALDPRAPVCHVSFYEADAYARWCAQRERGVRLPTEAEWEVAAEGLPIEGNFVETGRFEPAAPQPVLTRETQQMFGDVWEWTSSPYVAYPRFVPLAGPLAEYNGKFMCNQLVLRGGSCLSPRDHLRPTYRNFFAPSARWQMSGLRLARFTDVEVP
jgi:ergothioneine biosynthesis protein EgtB